MKFLPNIDSLKSAILAPLRFVLRDGCGCLYIAMPRGQNCVFGLPVATDVDIGRCACRTTATSLFISHLVSVDLTSRLITTRRQASRLARRPCFSRSRCRNFKLHIHRVGPCVAENQISARRRLRLSEW